MKIEVFTQLTLLSLYIAIPEFLSFATRSANTLVKNGVCSAESCVFCNRFCEKGVLMT